MTTSTYQSSDLPLDGEPLPDAAPAAPSAACRQWLAAIADVLIPAGSGMPSATQMDVPGGQLDAVLAARPDLAHHLVRAWTTTERSDAPEALEELQALDPLGYDAVRLVVAGGYYLHPEVRRLLAYNGHEPQPVRVDVLPEYVEEGLLERVVERGPRFRSV
jgi:hypothetical protein